MGTNYYLFPKPACTCCKRTFEPMHIGKSSGGWVFGLHVIPEDGIHDLQDWMKLWKKKGSYIENEYGERVTYREMLGIITDRNWNSSPDTPEGRDRLFPKGVVAGPNNLVRHEVDGKWCVKHGDGTWDCLVGEFS